MILASFSHRCLEVAAKPGTSPGNFVKKQKIKMPPLVNFWRLILRVNSEAVSRKGAKFTQRRKEENLF